MATRRSKGAKIEQGTHPNSLKNLIHVGRPSSEDTYGEPKTRRSLTLTETGAKGAKKIAKDAGYSSLSELIEYIGRGWTDITEIENSKRPQS